MPASLPTSSWKFLTVFLLNDLCHQPSLNAQYFNEEDGTTSWERPQNIQVEDATAADTGTVADAAPEMPVAGEVSSDVVAAHGQAVPEPDSQAEFLRGLPEGWTEETTDAGEIYYCHSDGRTQWDRPVAEEAAGDEPPSVIEDTQPADGFIQKELQQETSEDITPTTTAVDSQLLAPWELLYTPEGEAYYFNPDSGETSWEKPSAPSAPADYRTTAASAAAATTTAPSLSPVELRPRPAHAIASFGFGGKLSVMFPQQATSLMGGPTPTGPAGLRRGPVVIHTLSDIVDASDVALSNDSSCRDQYQPMITMDETEAYRIIEEKATTENAGLLWNLILIAARWNGRLRSINGANDRNSPEFEIVSLLLDSGKGCAMPSPMKMSAGAEAEQPGRQDDAAAGFEDIQDYLIRGERDEAVARAVSCKNYALAFLIAAMCDRETYQAVAKEFIDDALQSGTPLHTVSRIFSGSLNPPEIGQLDRSEVSSCWDDDSLNLPQTWHLHLAGILSNRTTGWEHVILALGDRLLQLDEVCPAHFCYMVSGCTITDPSHPMTRMSLVGCDHVVPQDIGLQSRQGIESYERTEAFEWAKRRGNPHAAIPTLQPFKLSYAKLLADYGLVVQAKIYVDSIRTCTGLGVVGDEREEARKRRYYSEHFEEDLDIFEDRVCCVLGVLSSMEKRREAEKKKGAVSRALENMSTVLSKGLSKPAGDDIGGAPNRQAEQRDESSVGGIDDPNSSFVSAMSMPAAATATGAAPPNARAGMTSSMAPIDEDAAQQSFEPAAQQYQPMFSPGNNNTNRLEDDNMSFVSATSNVLDTTGATFKSAHPFTSSGEAEGAPPPTFSPKAGAGPTTAAPSAADPFATAASLASSAPPPAAAASPFGHQPAGLEEPAKLPAAPKTAPAGPLPGASSGMSDAAKPPPASNKSDSALQSSETPSSKSGWSLRNFIAKKLHPDATVADLGDSGKMVYSQEFKVWYLDGKEDPETLAQAKAPPPPPTMAVPSTPSATGPAPSCASDDPLAALMAPRGAPAGMSRTTTGPPMNITTNSDVLPPQFSVFTPTPAKETSSQ